MIQKYVDDINKESENNEVKIFIEGEYFQLKEVNFPLFKIQDDFSNFIKNQLFSSILFIRSKKESEKSISFFNELYLKTELVIKDLTGKLSGIKRVIVIGSRATGLAEPDSLLDLYVEIGDSYFKNEWDESELCNQLKEVEVELKKLNHGQHLVFKNIKINGSTIEAIHWLTQMKCKIFCGNGLVVEKSKLIGLYVNSDDRVKRLILIIKEWAKYTHLPEDISNYSLTWIVLYYLIKVSLLKPVSALKNNVAKQKKSVSGWECGFDSDATVNLLQPNPKLKTNDELIRGFFEFYGNDDNILSVHCPLTGESFTKLQFKKLNLPCAQYENYIQFCTSSSSNHCFKLTKGFCLQDPIELNSNLTVYLAGKSYSKFKWFCKRMQQIL
ncbi:terminal uridylyltransferase Tailor-like isoform X3 [Lycorma delicatula]|uniref:terminal uridylyltransferase Tailor-like isoform X3 n=1 Tax=Lycorma delicatula TaxID=130591 RepID=UPI003F51142B